ncbi:metal-dependent phosphohydrolase [bacterium]|nr:MAG: metal-dependent phosphohydrolase [bacterium]
MFNPHAIVIEAFSQHLKANYQEAFGLLEPEYPSIIAFVSRSILENLSNCDAPYHNLEHTILVTEVGQVILRGRHVVTGALTPQDWLNATIAMLCHDVGYVRGICMGDTENEFIVNESGEKVSLKRGSTDAALLPYHVNRSKLFVQQWFGNKSHINVDAICEMIELTRFPMPNDAFYKQTDTLAGMVRAADLIGQMGDTHYLRKSAALYAEFVESGEAEQLNYQSAADLRENYPTFFWNTVSPLIQPAIEYLRRTYEGKQWLANLFSHVFTEEHTIKSLGASK